MWLSKTSKHWLYYVSKDSAPGWQHKLPSFWNRIMFSTFHILFPPHITLIKFQAFSLGYTEKGNLPICFSCTSPLARWHGGASRKRHTETNQTTIFFFWMLIASIWCQVPALDWARSIVLRFFSCSLSVVVGSDPAVGCHCQTAISSFYINAGLFLWSHTNRSTQSQTVCSIRREKQKKRSPYQPNPWLLSRHKRIHCHLSFSSSLSRTLCWSVSFLVSSSLFRPDSWTRGWQLREKLLPECWFVCPWILWLVFFVWWWWWWWIGHVRQEACGEGLQEGNWISHSPLRVLSALALPRSVSNLPLDFWLKMNSCSSCLMPCSSSINYNLTKKFQSM